VKKLIAVLILSFPFLAFGQPVAPPPLVVGKMVKSADVNETFIAIAFEGQTNGVDIPFQKGVVKLACSPGCPKTGLLLPKIRVMGADKSIRELPVPTPDIHEIVGASITCRISNPGAEYLVFSNRAALEIIAPPSDPRILMYAEDVAQGSGVAVLWGGPSLLIENAELIRSLLKSG
jgi:hypothetical protein